MLKIPTVDDWYCLSLKYRQFHRVSDTSLKDYGYMAIMDYLDSYAANNILEFGHGFNPTLLERYSKARMSGALMTIRVSPTSERPTAMRGKKGSIKKSDLRLLNAPSAAGSWAAAAVSICPAIISTWFAPCPCWKR